VRDPRDSVHLNPRVRRSGLSPRPTGFATKRVSTCRCRTSATEIEARNPGRTEGGRSSPEAGRLRLSSCRSRREEFVFDGTDPPTDAYAAACEDACVYESIEIEPTATADDPELVPRPWIENIDGLTNLPDGVTVADAARCILPQGINGCGFESPLESMYKALQRAMDSTDANSGFIRAGAHLAVVIVTDEADCSYHAEHASIFLQDGERAFWSDPDAAFPTSAVCWNAGVACSGGPGRYEDCHAENHDEGGATTTADRALLQPVSRYTDVLEAIQDEKRAHSDASVTVLGIVGVPSGYPAGAEIVYEDTDDAVFQDTFGIGPGCETVTGSGVPPVRVHELVEHFELWGERNLYSVCDADYSSALAFVADNILRLSE
jgi:hypothetical protein